MIESKKFKSTIPQSEMPGYAGLTEAINTVDNAFKLLGGYGAWTASKDYLMITKPKNATEQAKLDRHYAKAFRTLLQDGMSFLTSKDSRALLWGKPSEPAPKEKGLSKHIKIGG